MFSHAEIKQIYTLRDATTLFFNMLPRDMWMNNIVGAMTIAKALHNAAYARHAEVNELMTMLDKNPRLVLQPGDVVTPGGDMIKGVTPYEFALGAGDYELAEKVGRFFEKIPHGEKERLRQYERYKPHIDAMLTQEPYDLTELINLLKDASAEDVTALLNNDLTHESPLRDALIQFRRAHAPRIISEPCMHFNYASFQHALDILSREWSELFQASGNHNKIDFVCRQIIGFEMRRLPGVDRCRVAYGLSYKAPTERSYQCLNKYRTGFIDFPITTSDKSLDGLGIDFVIGIAYGEECGSLGSRSDIHWKNHLLAKKLSLETLYRNGCTNSLAMSNS